MKTTVYFISVIILTILTSCATTVKNEAYLKDERGNTTFSVEKKVNGISIENIKKTWETEYINDIGYAPVLKKYDDEYRNKELARRGALLDAQRNLARKVSSVRITETVMMSDLMTTDFVQSQLNAVLENVEVINERFDEKNNRYEITVRMPKIKLIKVVEEYNKLY